MLIETTKINSSQIFKTATYKLSNLIIAVRLVFHKIILKQKLYKVTGSLKYQIQYTSYTTRH